VPSQFPKVSNIDVIGEERKENNLKQSSGPNIMEIP
jgi:hypothetical protein